MSFAAAGHAEKQRRFGVAGVAYCGNAVIRPLLLLGQNHLVYVERPHSVPVRRAKDLLLIIFHRALFLKSVHDGLCGIGEIAYLLYADKLRLGKQLQNLRLLFRGLFHKAFALRRKLKLPLGKVNHPLRFVSHPAASLLLSAEQSPLRHGAYKAAVGISERLVYSLALRAAFFLEQPVYNALLLVVCSLFRLGEIPVRGLVVQSRREHGLDRFKQRAKGAFRKVPRQCRKLRRQHRLSIEHRRYVLYLHRRILRLCGGLKNHSLPFLCPRSERNKHPATGLCPPLQLLRNGIIKKLIKAERGLVNCYFRYQFRARPFLYIKTNPYRPDTDSRLWQYDPFFPANRRPKAY